MLIAAALLLVALGVLHSVLGERAILVAVGTTLLACAVLPIV